MNHLHMECGKARDFLSAFREIGCYLQFAWDVCQKANHQNETHRQPRGNMPRPARLQIFGLR